MPSWSHRVKVGGVDITDETLLAGATCELMVNGSGLFDFVWSRAAGPALPEAILLAACTLEIQSPLGGSLVLVFTGKILAAEWMPRERQYRVRASNRLQEAVRALGAPAAVAAAIPGCATSLAFHGPVPDDLWVWAEALMETTPYDLYIDAAGALQSTAIAAGSADHTLEAADIDGEGEAPLTMANAESLVNSVTLELSYSVTRKKIRACHVTWDYLDEPDTNTFCEWIQDRYWYPPGLATNIIPAFTGGNWSTPGGVSADAVPLNEPDLCFSGMPALEWYFAKDLNPCTAAAVWGYQAISQPYREVLTLTVTCPAAISAQGATVSDRRTAGLDVPAPTGWPPQSVDEPVGWAEDALGDYYQDHADESGRSDLIQAGYQWARTRILRAQRGHSRTLRTRLRPAITLAHTVESDADGVDCRGKVTRIRHDLGAARTELTISLSRGGGGSDGSWSVPSRPASPNPVTYWEAIDGPGTYPDVVSEVALPTYVGGEATSADYPDIEAEQGWFTNKFPGDISPETYPDKYYPVGMVVDWPGIEAQASGGMEVEYSASATVAAPDDPITVS